jgi:hypothetical protein
MPEIESRILYIKVMFLLFVNLTVMTFFIAIKYFKVHIQ